MAYQFPSDIQQRLIARLSCDGIYNNEDDIIRDAMDALDQLEQEKIARWESRNQLAESQSRQGLSKPLDDKKVIARLRERLAQEGILD